MLSSVMKPKYLIDFRGEIFELLKVRYKPVKMIMLALEKNEIFNFFLDSDTVC